MKILLIGKNGQVGYELVRSLQGLGDITALDRGQMDLGNLLQIRTHIRDIKPDLIINAAAYTSVDKAEVAYKCAMRINAEAPSVMAEEAKKLGAAMIHYSTDYVFDGEKMTPYTEDDCTNPLNVYGQSKLLGEKAIQVAGIPYLIFRTSWVYGMRGKNFLLTVLRLAREHNELRIVGDQYGAPTWCRTIADTTVRILAQALGASSIENWWQEKSGLYHLAAQGQTTWAGFAEAILSNTALKRKIVAISTEEYPLLAKRPRYSVISSKKLMHTFYELPAWQAALNLCQLGCSFNSKG